MFLCLSHIIELSNNYCLTYPGQLLTPLSWSNYIKKKLGQPIAVTQDKSVQHITRFESNLKSVYVLPGIHLLVSLSLPFQIWINTKANLSRWSQRRQKGWHLNNKLYQAVVNQLKSGLCHSKYPISFLIWGHQAKKIEVEN